MRENLPARFVREAGRSEKRRRRRRGGSAAFTRPGIQREIGASALRLAESGRRKERIVRGRGSEEKGSCMNEFGERLLSSLKGPRALLHLLSPCISISPREIFSHANDLALHFRFFFLFALHTPVLHSFFITIREKRVERLGDDFQSRS